MPRQSSGSSRVRANRIADSHRLEEGERNRFIREHPGINPDKMMAAFINCPKKDPSKPHMYRFAYLHVFVENGGCRECQEKTV